MNRMRLLEAALLGVWIGWTLFMWFAAGSSFTTVDRISSSPSAGLERVVQPLGAENTRLVLRHAASEINRTLFRGYGWVEIALGAILLLLVWRDTPRDTLALTLVGVMLALILILTLVITPWMISLGRSIDFGRESASADTMRRFWTLHGAFTGLDGAKLLAGIVLLVRWIVRS
jgi:Domain of unknown function (DUF4149)